jgi:hypothetical protein
MKRPPNRRQTELRRLAERMFRQRLQEFVRLHMPWPYDDVPRKSQEAIEAAEAATAVLHPVVWAFLTAGFTEDEALEQMNDARPDSVDEFVDVRDGVAWLLGERAELITKLSEEVESDPKG